METKDNCSRQEMYWGGGFLKICPNPTSAEHIVYLHPLSYFKLDIYSVLLILHEMIIIFLLNMMYRFSILDPKAQVGVYFVIVKMCLH